MATYTEILAEAKTALLAILQGRVKSYNVGPVEYSYHNLDELKNLIKELENLAASESTTSRPKIMPADISGRPG